MGTGMGGPGWVPAGYHGHPCCGRALVRLGRRSCRTGVSQPNYWLSAAGVGSQMGVWRWKSPAAGTPAQPGERRASQAGSSSSPWGPLSPSSAKARPARCCASGARPALPIGPGGCGCPRAVGQAAGLPALPTPPDCSPFPALMFPHAHLSPGTFLFDLRSAAYFPLPSAPIPAPSPPPPPTRSFPLAPSFSASLLGHPSWGPWGQAGVGWGLGVT